MFFVGLFGAAIAAKVFFSNICTKENQTHIFAWAVSGPVMMAMSFGPAIGGYLALPSKKYSWLFSETGIFGKYPILLVNGSTGAIRLLLALANHLLLKDDGQASSSNVKHNLMSEGRNTEREMESEDERSYFQQNHHVVDHY